MSTPTNRHTPTPRRTRHDLRLTDHQARSLHSILAMVVGDPDWVGTFPREMRAIVRVVEKLEEALRASG